MNNKTCLDNSNLPKEEGVYLAIGIWGDRESKEIEVYKHPIKGLSCFAEDFGSAGTGVDDSTDCHVSIQHTGLEFITKLRNLN